MTIAQLRAVGWDKSAVARRVADGRLHPVFRGVYSLGGPQQSERELWMAATLSYGKGARLSHSAAAELYGLLRYPLRAIHVTTPTKRPSRERITPHHRSDPAPWKYIDRIPVTSPEQTILDCAQCVTNDKAYRRIVRQAQADELTSHTRLLALGAMNPGARGLARLNRELRDGPSRTRSANEDEVLEVFRHGGEPVPNAIIAGDEVDLFFPRLGVAVEVQGPPHENPTARADDIAKEQRLAARGVRVLWIS